MTINTYMNPYEDLTDSGLSDSAADSIWGAPEMGEYNECTLCGEPLSGDETTMGICDACAGL